MKNNKNTIISILMILITIGILFSINYLATKNNRMFNKGYTQRQNELNAILEKAILQCHTHNGGSVCLDGQDCYIIYKCDGNFGAIKIGDTICHCTAPVEDLGWNKYLGTDKKIFD